ncbi:hypothetical protein OIU85_007495, partial [Salix viminalis]
ANTPEFMVISTPAAKEHARVLRKRKCIFDDVVVFPNNVIKQCIEDTGDLVSKRRKLPHTAFAVWKACRFSNLDKCFLEFLIPCTSLELGSLFRTKRLQIQETVKSVGGSVETVEPFINSDTSESQNIGGSVETAETLEKSNVSGSPSASRFAETLERPGKLDIAESPTAGGCLEQLAIAPETPIQCTTLLRSFESPERPDIYDEDGQSSETVKKEICCNLDHELDLNLLNEDMITSGDNQEHSKNYKKWVVRKNQSGSEMLACKFSDTEEKKTGGKKKLSSHNIWSRREAAEEILSQARRITH